MKTFRAYMHDEFGIEVPHDNIPGLGFPKTASP